MARTDEDRLSAIAMAAALVVMARGSPDAFDAALEGCCRS
jgi:hypothetical protein